MIVTVPLTTGPYDVVIGRGLLGSVGAHRGPFAGAGKAAIVTQPPVRRHADVVADSLAGHGLAVDLVEVDDGEAAKSPAVLGRLWERFASLALGRRDLVVAVGGGTVGDLAGFAAATWNRGVAVLQVPTTLLAQVDAAIGGKTGINLPAGKNLVGAFHQPVGVVVDLDTLDTLPARIRVEGLGEVVKYGLSHDPAILEVVESDPGGVAAGSSPHLAELIERAVRIKAAVVARDEREAGERAHLNLGHTYGHALEALTGYRDYLHGEAVAVGLVVALETGEAMGVTPAGTAARARTVLAGVGLPTTAPRLDRAAVWATMGRDKKARDGVRFVLIEDLGRPVVVAADRDAVDAAIDAVEVPAPEEAAGDG